MNSDLITIFMEDKFLKVAKQASLEAGKVIKKYSGKIHQKSIKNEDPSDFATEADLQAEEKIVEILSKNFPLHNIIAEEKTSIKKGSEYTWVIDPMDGTISFTNNLPFYAVGIGLLKNNMPILGVIYHVSADKLYWAQSTKGAHLNNKKIHISRKTDLGEAIIVLDFGHKVTRQGKFETYINPLKNKVGYLYSLGGFSAGMGLLSAGSFDAAVAQGWVWDFVAGTVIVREAGGKVTDFEGNEPDWTKERLNIVASNGLIHDQILEALK